jgi:hypothetical protein
MTDKDRIAKFIGDGDASLKRMGDTVERMRAQQRAAAAIIANCEKALAKYEELHRSFAAQLDEIMQTTEREPFVQGGGGGALK